jgi:hypothetical protein
MKISLSILSSMSKNILIQNLEQIFEKIKKYLRKLVFNLS